MLKTIIYGFFGLIGVWLATGVVSIGLAKAYYMAFPDLNDDFIVWPAQLWLLLGAAGSIALLVTLIRKKQVARA